MNVRASSQELNLLPQLLGDFGECSLYKKMIGRLILKYKAILCSDLDHSNLFCSYELGFASPPRYNS